MPEAADILERLDAIMAGLAELRAELVASAPVKEITITDNDSADDMAPACLLDTHAAQERFGYPQDTIRKWCRTEDLGVLRGGRWLVSVPRLRRRINGK